mgnify:FL=1|tara:strand:- start:305 stop:871 length:567 start_codon:yes stop_codon:yes gene_type:complete
MATFPSIQPTYGTRKNSAPLSRTVRFADGYEHRILFGLSQNQNPKIYNLTFNVSETDADVISAFLNSRANDQASFTFTPPEEGISKTGTYSQSGTTVTNTITNHGIAIGETVTLDFTTGSATDGTFVVVTAVDSNTFTVTASSSGTNSGNVTATVSGASQFVCDKWNKNIYTKDRATITATFREVFEP